MKFSTLLPVAFAASSVLAIPTATIDKRATTICGQWDSVVTGTYTVYDDFWNEGAGKGSQCTTVNSLSGTTLAWSTAWSWAGGNGQVKSFANAVVKMSSIKKVSAIASIPSVWKWSYTGTSLVADVAYDLFTSSTPTGSNQYEIMIWLAALGGAGPISSTGSPVATPTIDGVAWKLFKGPNGAMTVFSFVAQSTTNSFSGDLKAFLTYLQNNQGFSGNQYLLSLGAGTEPFTGSSAVFTTSAYSCVVN